LDGIIGDTAEHVTLISLGVISGTGIGKYSKGVFAGFARILARIAVEYLPGRNACGKSV